MKSEEQIREIIVGILDNNRDIGLKIVDGAAAWNGGVHLDFERSKHIGYISAYADAAGIRNLNASFQDNLLCALDGNALSIVRKDFINLAESKSVFIELTQEQIDQIKELEKEVSEPEVEENKPEGETK